MISDIDIKIFSQIPQGEVELVDQIPTPCVCSLCGYAAGNIGHTKEEQNQAYAVGKVGPYRNSMHNGRVYLRRIKYYHKTCVALRYLMLQQLMESCNSAHELAQSFKSVQDLITEKQANTLT